MATYTHEYSDFPNSVYSLRRFLDLKDAPEAIADVIVEIKQHIAKKDFSSAASLLEQHKANLAQYMVDATYINTLGEELRNLEIYTKSKKQALYYQTAKPDGVTGDVWIS
jgi:hypothetical protein